MKQISWIRKLLFILFLGFMVYCPVFVLTHRHVVLNRYTDSWWHVSAANEYALTGEFAKDPFFADAPKFAPFGFMDYLVAKMKILGGVDERKGWCVLVALGVAVFLLSGFLAGYWINRDLMEGSVCGFVSALVSMNCGVVGLGFPFPVALSLLMFLLVSVCFSFKRGGTGETANGLFPGYSDSDISGVIWRGLLLGVIFDIHAFVGVVGCVLMALIAGRDFLAAFRVEKDGTSGNTGKQAGISSLVRAGLTFAFFWLAAWRWFAFLYSLRPVLRENNAHMTGTYEVIPRDIIVLMCGILMAVLSLDKKKEHERMFLVLCVGAGGLLLLCCVPCINKITAGMFSSFMASRWPLFFPCGVVSALAVSYVMSRVQTWRDFSFRSFAVVAVCMVMLVPGGVPNVLLHRYLLKTHDYDRHDMTFVRDALGDRYRGKTILSDPWTSYFARGMAGAYVITVPSGNASPAVDYGKRDRLVKSALLGGPGKLVGRGIDAVLVTRKDKRTGIYAGAKPEDIVSVWVGQGWVVTWSSDDLIVLEPSDQPLM